jgi:hypothetical protein
VSVQTLLYNTYLQIISGGSQPFVGPLDDYTTGLSVALLPFRGFASYEGAGWRVRDTNDDSEQDIEFDPVTGDPVAPVLVGDGGIRWWYEQSGNGYNAGNTVSLQQPLFTQGVINGRPVARFDGSNDGLFTSAIPTEQQRTVYAVLRKRTASTNVAARGISIAGSLGYAIIDCDLGGGEWSWAFDNSDSTPAILGGSVQDWSLVSVTLTVSEAKPLVNNSAGSTFVPSFDFTDSGIILLGGGSASVNVDIAALLVYSTQHDDTTRQAIQTILAEKFNITLA